MEETNDKENDMVAEADAVLLPNDTELVWMERQPKCNHIQLLTVKWMRNLSSQKLFKKSKQLTFIEMFCVFFCYYLFIIIQLFVYLVIRIGSGSNLSGYLGTPDVTSRSFKFYLKVLLK